MSPNSLRLKIVELVYKSKEGHIPSAFSIVDIIYYIYKDKQNFVQRWRSNMKSKTCLVYFRFHGREGGEKNQGKELVLRLSPKSLLLILWQSCKN